MLHPLMGGIKPLGHFVGLEDSAGTLLSPGGIR
jgi:hypothetical protein